MSQQINLYNPLFRPRGFSFTSATAMLYGIGILVVLAALFAVYENYSLRALQDQAQSVELSYKNANARVESLSTELKKSKPSAQLEKEVAALDAQLKDRQEIVDTLKGGAIGNVGGFSEYMRAFSRQNVNGLWLTGFDIARAGNELAIQGRTVSADLVASYLAQLNREPALQGREFAALRISQPPPEPAKPDLKAGQVAGAQKDAKDQKPAAPRYLEFIVSTVEPAESQKAALMSVPAPLLGAIESAAVLDASKAGAKPGAAR